MRQIVPDGGFPRRNFIISNRIAILRLGRALANAPSETLGTHLQVVGDPIITPFFEVAADLPADVAHDFGAPRRRPLADGSGRLQERMQRMAGDGR